MKHRLLIVAVFVFVASCCAMAQIVAPSSPPSKKPWVDVVRDCGAKGDNVTNDGPAIQACLTANPGRTIFFPTMAASCSGGGCKTTPSYYSSQTLTMSGNNQRLLGDTGGMWAGGSAIRFAAATSGIVIPSTCYSCKIERLELQSPDTGPTSANGILVQGGHARLNDLVVDGFGNNCIEIDGATSNANTWRASYILMNVCKAHGWYAHGTDANAGVAIGLYGRANGTVDIEDAAAYPNLYLASETEIGAPLHYKDTAGSSGAIWIGSYMEGAQPSAIKGMVFGGHMLVDTTVGYPMLWNIGNGMGTTIQSQTWLEVWGQKDEDTLPSFRSGKTTDNNTTLRFLTFNGLSRWGVRRQANNNTLKIWNYLTSSAPLSIDPTTNVTTLTGISTGSAGSANKAVCWKTATTLGYCSTKPDANGACTCN